MRIDLHTHSTASDGTDTPAELIATASAVLDVVAITDHDTTAGWDEAIAARPDSLTVVTGTELSCVYRRADHRPVNLHLLAYLFDRADPGLRAERARLRASRFDRGRAIVELMVADGVPITWERVTELAAGGAVGRPHIGRALVEAAVVSSVDEAFAGVLNSRSPYYVRKENTDVFAALRMVQHAGGVTVFAHPLAHRRGPIVDDSAIAELAAAGLTGLEVDHPDHDPAVRAHARGLAAELDLVRTGSSDYHGTNKTVRIGENLTDPAQYERLVAAARAGAPIGKLPWST